MPSLRRKLPSPNALMTFEAAARSLSFTAAASELNVTQAAVSRQIAALESRLGVGLFNRKQHHVTLTAEGRILSSAVSEGYGLMEAAVERITCAEGRSTLVIGATTAFSHFWLLPRLSEFRRMFPDIAVRIIAQDMPIRVDQGDIQAVFRFGDGTWNDGESILLFDEAVGPVCSPAYFSRIRTEHTLEDLIKSHPLIELDFPDVFDLTWANYVHRSNHRTTRIETTLEFSSYLDVVYAALADQGLALGWRRLVGKLIEDQRLVSLSLPMPVPEAYYLVVNRHASRSGGLSAFTEWVRKVATE